MSESSFCERRDGAQGANGDHASASRSPKSDLLELLRKAVEFAQHTHDSLAAAMAVDRSYVSKVLDGTKPLGAKFVDGLPDDVGAILGRLLAESHGQVVIEPLKGHEAVLAFAAGLIGMFAAGLPVRAERMARMTGGADVGQQERRRA